VETDPHDREMAVSRGRLDGGAQVHRHWRTAETWSERDDRLHKSGTQLNGGGQATVLIATPRGMEL
jgi:ABC-type phosphate transport system ATPase subunit